MLFSPQHTHRDLARDMPISCLLIACYVGSCSDSKLIWSVYLVEWIAL